MADRLTRRPDGADPVDTYDPEKDEGLSVEERINLLGPWTHADFELGDGVRVKSSHPAHLTRIRRMRAVVLGFLAESDIARTANEKTLLDVGCNAGYFSIELQKAFHFDRVLGIDPRERNIRKARFIASQLGLDTELSFQTGDILSESVRELGEFDVVLFLGVLYHLDDPLRALENIFRLTKDLLVLETMILNPASVRLERLWPQPKNFELMATECEADTRDGAAARTGIVQVPSLGAVRMLLEHVGFDNVRVLMDGRSEPDPMNTAILAARKPSPTLSSGLTVFTSSMQDQSHEGQRRVPLPIARWFYARMNPDLPSPQSQNGVVDDVVASLHWWLFRIRGLRGSYLRALVAKLLPGQDLASLYGAFRHAPADKACLEYAKSLHAAGLSAEALVILNAALRKASLDWDVVYQGYFLRACIHRDQGDTTSFRRDLEKSLFANPRFQPACREWSETNR